MKVSDARLLWTGGGAYGSAPRVRRARHRLRTVVSEHPTVYLPFARRKYLGPSPRVVGPGTAAVIDGYTRSASTFAVYAFQIAQPRPVALAHHLHAAAQLIEAARRRLPTLVVTREAKGALLSQLVREPDVDLLEALYAYRRFYTALLPYKEAFVIGAFKEVTSSFGEVTRRMNDTFGSSFGIFGGSEEELALCARMVRQRATLSPVLLGFESGEVTLQQALAHLEQIGGAAGGGAEWVPSAARDAAKAALEARWYSPALSSARAAAEHAYLSFVEGS